MKKLLMIALVLNLVSCSNDTDETSSTQVAETKPSSFNPNPTPEDYRKANYPNFMSDLLTMEHAIEGKSNAQRAPWVNTYVPDAAFRAKLISLGAATDTNTTDNYVMIDQGRAGLNLTGAGISNLTGVKAFTSLVQLSVGYNNLTTLDVAGMTTLGVLECNNNLLTTLNLSTNTNLSQIWCNNNQLTSLTIPSAVNTLWGVWCYGNQLTTLNLNGNVKITDLFIHSNKLTALNFSTFSLLKQINCSTNRWTTLNFDSNPKLTFMYCTGNTLLTDIRIKNGYNPNIINPSFMNNTKAPAIHVDDLFLPSANTAWPNKGTSSYVL
ncbi:MULTISPECIES: hypothetical protein [unclassified Flavobacterium]|uniref:hypothetical protein n=1 Tax=unclassified Flavobacterium TaxID=196869 RepID=UPI0036067D68